MWILNKSLSMALSSILITYFIAPAELAAQESGISLEFNLGANPDSPLRSFHKGLTEQVDLENFKTTDNFYYNYGFTVGWNFNDINSGIFYSNRVSGAKTSVSDYSGYLRLTNELNGHTIGYKYYLLLKSRPKGNLFAQFKGLATFSKFDVISDSQISGNAEFDSLNFKSTDFGVGAGVLYEYSVGFVVLRAYLDLDIYYGGKIRLKDNDSNDGFLLNANGKKLTTGWGGLTSGLGITIPI